MKTLRSFSGAQRADLPTGKSVLGTLLILAAIAALPVVGRAQSDPPTAVTPIQHVIVVFGENRSFDHVFGTYVPKAGQSVWNLLSQGIVNANGTPGKHFKNAHQYDALDLTTYAINPPGKALYDILPPPLAGGDTACSDTSGEPFCTLSVAVAAEPNLPTAFQNYLITGGTGITKKNFDTRITNDLSLPPGPFQLTNGSTLFYDDYAASPIHRFYQMWQQTDCTYTPRGAILNDCKNDLFPWVETTSGDSNGALQPIGFSTNGEGSLTTGEGSTSMGFYNMLQGDAPYLTQLANQYTLLDNMHQSVMGGTGANHIVLGYGDAMVYTNGSGSPATPPSNQIENPNPQPGSNNYYTQDGYGGALGGGSYTNCSQESQPGVKPIVTYLSKLGINPNCDDGNYYLLNNYDPGYNGDGTVETFTPFTIPPTTQRHIGDVLGAAGLTYTFFGEQWNLYLTDLAGQNPLDDYCNICNVFQYATDIMTSPAQISAHIQDLTDNSTTGAKGFFSQVAAGTLPNVSIIQPSGFTDGHPATSKLDLWEGEVQSIVTSVQANPTLWSSTAIILIFDEGGGYYDSGYIQPIDFFGDGTRMPSLIVSPYTTGGNVYHGYADHVSIDKFIERNWNLPTISFRSRDNLPDPLYGTSPYVPINGPAIDDLFGAFNFQ
ncbi:MAG: alkaline phosphatase family protein [Terriglobales bacterium]